MRVLKSIVPTPEQLKIVSLTKAGPLIIRGAAGSGKTSTALLRLKTLQEFFLQRKKRLKSPDTIRILVLTYNRTLRGYIHALADGQVKEVKESQIEISTFGKWAKNSLGPKVDLLKDGAREQKIRELGSKLGLETDFLLEEVDYVLGRYAEKNLKEYIATKRVGRGNSPHMDAERRQRLLSEVINPYRAWKKTNKKHDWNDLAIAMADKELTPPYDIIIADEVQDFSANQIRAILNHLKPVHSVTFVLDAAQRIYARGFTWIEVGLEVRPENSFKLGRNHRNTKEIATFAKPIIEGLQLDDDGTLPDLNSCERNGPLPIVLKGKFSGQTKYIVNWLRKGVDLKKESVGILHPRGHGCFEYIKGELDKAKFKYVEITRKSEWPEGEENIAFSTLHSAKGLEFDHVCILGLNEEFTPHGGGDEDDQLEKLRRLFAMGITRARGSVFVGYKPEEASILTKYLKKGTFTEVKV